MTTMDVKGLKELLIQHEVDTISFIFRFNSWPIFVAYLLSQCL